MYKEDARPLEVRLAEATSSVPGGPISLPYADTLTKGVSDYIDDLFAYHQWTEEQSECGALVRDVLGLAVKVIVAKVPPCAGRTRAINNIMDARMLSNAAITFNVKK